MRIWDVVTMMIVIDEAPELNSQFVVGREETIEKIAV